MQVASNCPGREGAISHPLPSLFVRVLLLLLSVPDSTSESDSVLPNSERESDLPMNCGPCGTPDWDSDPPTDRQQRERGEQAAGPAAVAAAVRRRQKLTKVNSLLQAVGRQLHQETEPVRVEPGSRDPTVAIGEEERRRRTDGKRRWVWMDGWIWRKRRSEVPSLRRQKCCAS